MICVFSLLSLESNKFLCYNKMLISDHCFEHHLLIDVTSGLLQAPQMLFDLLYEMSWKSLFEGPYFVPVVTRLTLKSLSSLVLSTPGSPGGQKQSSASLSQTWQAFGPLHVFGPHDQAKSDFCSGHVWRVLGFESLKPLSNFPKIQK